MELKPCVLVLKRRTLNSLAGRRVVGRGAEAEVGYEYQKWVVGRQKQKGEESRN
jgi:hypothetical protein